MAPIPDSEVERLRRALQAHHAADTEGALFRPVSNNRTGRLDNAMTPDGVYKPVRRYALGLGLKIGAPAVRWHTWGENLERSRRFCGSLSIQGPGRWIYLSQRIGDPREAPLGCPPIHTTGKDHIMSRIENKVVAITGASSGIGEATALLLAERGAKVVLGARGLDRLKALADRIEAAGGDVAYVPTDVKRRDDTANLVMLACERYGKLDVLFSNAGVMPVSPLDELRVDDWNEMIDINIKGVLYGIAAALPVFREQGFGHFINTASTAGHKTVANQSVYSGTKFAVRAISEGLRQEAGDKLRVTIISPGFVRTNFAESVTSPQVKAELEISRDKFAIPPDAIARAIVFAIEQPAEVDVNEIVIRPTAQP
jgi:NADP-dependent 3-hydroxy acid dehydrogenase YdfG